MIIKKPVVRVEKHPGLSDPGDPPQIIWLPKDCFVVDLHYQRSVKSMKSQDNIQHITAHFSWNRFSPPTVTAAGDSGKYIIVDGQHRIEAIRGRPDIDKVPCYVIGELTQNEQARVFVAINSDRVALTTYALFNAQCAAGDLGALKVREICEEADIKISKFPVPGGLTAPRETQALATIKRGIETCGEDNVIAALMIIPETFKFAPGMMHSRMIGALVQFYYVRGIKSVDRELLKKVLADRDSVLRECDARAAASVNKTKTGEELLKKLNSDYETEVIKAKQPAISFK